MYVIKNALRCIGRAKGRNILIGVIVFVIAVSACLGLSIRQAAESAKEEALAELSITATISFDRQSMMSEMRGGNTKGGFDREQFSEKMEDMSGLTLEEYQTYAKAESVEDFYYTVTASLNGTDDFSSVTTDTDEETDSNTANSGGNMPDMGNMQGGFGGMNGRGGMEKFGGMQGDFTVIGYSDESAMTDFIDGTATVTEGEVFAEGTTAYNCIISDELAAFNDTEVGDKISLANPNDEEECYTLTVVGIYTDTSSNESGTSFMGMTASDPANQIYMSYNALEAIVKKSESVATTTTDEKTGRQSSSKISGQLSGTYVFADVAAYEQFETEVRALGLDDSYTVTSQDIKAFENSLVPLNTLGQLAGYFLMVILAIGAVILVVLHIFNVRERKYEIGVLTAMGMKKGKVALQFICEIFVVTLAAIIIGAGVGAVGSVPVTNALLENQVESQQSRSDRIEQGFGRAEAPTPPDGEAATAPEGMDGGKGGFMGGMQNAFNTMMGRTENAYVTEVSAAMNFTVVLQMLGIGLLLTLISGGASMLFVMRYEPLKILANRD